MGMGIGGGGPEYRANPYDRNRAAMKLYVKKEVIMSPRGFGAGGAFGGSKGVAWHMGGKLPATVHAAHGWVASASGNCWKDALTCAPLCPLARACRSAGA